MRYIDSGERNQSQALGNWIEEALTEDVTELRWQSGFFSFAGAVLFIPTINRLVSQSQVVNVLIGANEGSTLRSDIQELMTQLGIPDSETSRLGIISFSGGAFFHPKVYHLRYRNGRQSAYVGSANLTESGVASLHVEAGVILDTLAGDDEITLENIATAIDNWFMCSRQGFTLVNSLTVLDQLVSDGVIAAALPPRVTTATGGVIYGRATRPRLVPLISLPASPTSERREDTEPEVEQTPPLTIPSVTVQLRVLVWTKKLPKTCALQVKAGSHSVGCVRLTQAKFRDQAGQLINHAIYFRNLFTNYSWNPVVGGQRGQEEATVPIQISIRGINYGIRNFKINHKPTGAAGQGNYTTSLIWGSFSPIVRSANLTGATFLLYETPAAPISTFSIDIT